MRCFNCKSMSTRPGSVLHKVRVAEFEFAADLPAIVCDECGETAVNLDAIGAFELGAARHLATEGARSAEAFRFMRKALGFRATDFAELLGVAVETISRWERGKHPIDTQTFGLLGSLVVERFEGSDRTLRRLRAISTHVASEAPVAVDLTRDLRERAFHVDAHC